MNELITQLQEKHFETECQCGFRSITGKNIHTGLSIQFAIKCMEQNISITELSKALAEIV